MGRRVLRHAERAGLSPAELATVTLAHELAMAVRIANLPDEHHADFLHPGRTALILLTDAGVRDGSMIAASCICETLRPLLRVREAEITASLGAAIWGLASSVPAPGDSEDLAEQLVTASEQTQVIALAEHLDHARHLHLRPPVEWPEGHSVTCTVYMPLALRTHPGLHRRLRWWCGMFEERYLSRF
jgi:hypothetical protein